MTNFNYIGNKPIQPIVNVVDAKAPSTVSVDPTNTWMIVLDRPELISIDQLAQPEVRLAGLRIDPQTHSESRRPTYTGLALLRIQDGHVFEIENVPTTDVAIDRMGWSPDGTKFAFTVKERDRLTLWIGSTQTQACHRLSELRLNATLAAPFVWSSDSQSLLCLAINDDLRGQPPKPHQTAQPIIQETDGQKAPARTYQDLIESPHDEDLFEYFTSSEVVRVDLNGRTERLPVHGLIQRIAPSPDSNYILVERIERPFSYIVPYQRFPRSIDLFDRDGTLVHTLTKLPLAENIPIGFDAVRQGPRLVHWRGDAPSTLLWAEAQDKGDPNVDADVRDAIYSLDAPFQDDPIRLIGLEFRYATSMASDDSLMVVCERWRKTRRERMWMISPNDLTKKPTLLHDVSLEDRYHYPGLPLTRFTSYGTRVLLTTDSPEPLPSTQDRSATGGRSLYFVGVGASPEGNRPFLDRLQLDIQSKTRLWRSEAPYYERPIRLIDPERGILLTRRETVTDPPNYFLRNLSVTDQPEPKTGQVTYFPNTTPELSTVRREMITYKRSDGVDLSAHLYLPPGYTRERGPLPLLMWAYPREYKSASAAGQVSGSPYEFFRIQPRSPLYLLLAGYAILDGPTMPIIGVGNAEPNDTYVEQLVMSAEAAVTEVIKRGVTEKNRIAIGGHSYGAFMTANLLAHTDLFRAGIARSGAFNRTLTPFGFQSEERTFWEAPDVYMAMSPFAHADQIDAPLLLIHGEADNNAGTFPMQSERLYSALKGLGKKARLCLLPFESHGYRARESVLHMLWEMQDWLDRYVKQA